MHPTPPRPPEAPRRRRAGAQRAQRGVALLITVVSIALLTVVATDFAYNSRVDLQLAANQRDEVRAYYMARSGVGLARLLLRFQGQVDQMSNVGSALTGGRPAGGAAPQAAALPKLQLWKMARVDCHLLKGLVTSEGAPPEEVAAPDPAFQFDETAPEAVSATSPRRSFGGFEGCFLADITNEEERINVHRLSSTNLAEAATFRTLVQLFEDKRFEFLFEREDAHGVKPSAVDIPLAMRDWMDEDTVQTALNTSGGGGSLLLPGFTDEGGVYDRYEPRYRPKNARFDSVDELYRVHGVSDRFMAAFRDRLTVFPDPNEGINVNSDDPLLIAAAIFQSVNPDPRLEDPVFLQAVITQVRLARAYSFLGLSVTGFHEVLKGAQLTLVQASAQSSPVTDKARVFRIRSVGEAGAVQKTLTAVVQLDQKLGRLLYWREE